MRTDAEQRRLWSSRSLLAALLAVVAVSMRPYFLLPAILIAPWRVARSGIPIFGSFRSWRMLCWILSLALLEAMVDFPPYWLMGHREAAVAALRLLAQPFAPASQGETLRRQLSDWTLTDPIVFIGLSSGVVLFTLIALVLIRQKSLRTVTRAQCIDGLLLCILMPSSLWLSIAMKHYYEHYLHHYLPFAMVGFAFLFSFAFHINDGLVLPRRAALLLTGLLLLEIFFLSKNQVHASMISIFRPQKDQRLTDHVAIESSRNRSRIKAEIFLHPYRMYAHWRYGKSRLGFPDLFNTQMILRGAWRERVKVPAYYSMPIDSVGYCDKLRRLVPRFLFSSARMPPCCWDA